MKYQVYNASSSHIKVGADSVAPGKSIILDQISLDLRTLEEQGFLKIRGFVEPKPTPAPAGPAKITPKPTSKKWTKNPEVR